MGMFDTRPRAADPYAQMAEEDRRWAAHTAAMQQEQERQQAALAWRQLMHLLGGGRPSRDPNFDPAAVQPPVAPQMPPAIPQAPIGPGMLGPVNGAFPAYRGPYPPRTPSVGVRG